eukprot:TRINITY_DN4249_c0_g1_i1.p1 TRINITY_DN4249_c0_g1~~TRINITY_DN4249_c0_g1_i1.p1  ORF type:complete len:208 (+),score=23.07 TRINITY_DN4249_c0_g1_i1:60-626(+)
MSYTTMYSSPAFTTALYAACILAVVFKAVSKKITKEQIERSPHRVAVVLQDGSEKNHECIKEFIRKIRSFGATDVTLYHTEQGVLPSIEGATRLLSIKDGKKTFDDFTKSHDRADISEELITKNLPPFKGADPEMLFVFGLSRSIYGFPAWPLYVTEIVFNDDIGSYTDESFLKDMLHYSQTKAVKGV